MTRKPEQHSRRLSSADFDPAVLKLFDEYVHGLIDRRGFLRGAAGLAIGATAASGLLASLSPSFAAQLVAPDDPRLDTGYHEFASADGYGTGRGYLARPSLTPKDLPPVLVVHENRGLNPHIEDVTRRLALQGFLAFAPDALFPLGGYPGDEDQARTLFGTLDQSKTREDMEAAARWLLAHPDGNRNLGVIGFCYGGAIANLLATRLPEIKAAVPFYGGAAPLDQVDRIRAELLVVLAADDERVNAGWPAYEAALQQADVRYALFQPPDTVHGFHNDTTPRYHEAAARQAWERALDLFERQLRVTAAE